jgi:hypothetical protein
MTTYEIEVASDQYEADQFIQWLNDNGYEAAIGDSTGNYVNRIWTNADEKASEIFNRLWDQYCGS